MKLIAKKDLDKETVDLINRLTRSYKSIITLLFRIADTEVVCSDNEEENYDYNKFSVAKLTIRSILYDFDNTILKKMVDRKELGDIEFAEGESLFNLLSVIEKNINLVSEYIDMDEE